MMKFKQICLFLLVGFVFFGCDYPETFNVGDYTLTVGDRMNLSVIADANGASGSDREWVSSDPKVAEITPEGIVIARNITTNSSGQYRQGAGTGSAAITLTADRDEYIFNITTTTAGSVHYKDLPSMKERVKARFGNNFMFGNIGGSISQQMRDHFDTITAENNMKPEKYTDARNETTGEITYTWATADGFVNSAQNAGMKIIGHTLLWHSQNPSWMTSQVGAKIGGTGSNKDNPKMEKEAALSIMKAYITEVVNRYKGKIYSWDVLNEAFPDGGWKSDWKDSMRPENPWYFAIGSDFVYEGFLAARLADPGAILYYNDFNTDNHGKATMIIAMVTEVNNRYLDLAASSKPAGDPAGRLLIEGIGMQEHHNLSVPASNIRTTLDRIESMIFSSGAQVKVSVSELDVLGQTWGQFSPVGQGTNRHGSSTVTNAGLVSQMNLYAEYMKVYYDYRNIIERISFWGITDNASWRSGGLPLLFDSKGMAKPAYYGFINALN